MMGIAALLSIFGVAMLFVTVAFALATTLPAWIAALIVAGVLLVAAGATAMAGWSKRVKKPLGTTQKTIKEDIQWAKNRAA
jgi:apolipoprotein N-acyltransferase